MQPLNRSHSTQSHTSTSPPQSFQEIQAQLAAVDNAHFLVHQDPATAGQPQGPRNQASGEEASTEAYEDPSSRLAARPRYEPIQRTPENAAWLHALRASIGVTQPPFNPNEAP